MAKETKDIEETKTVKAKTGTKTKKASASKKTTKKAATVSAKVATAKKTTTTKKASTSKKTTTSKTASTKKSTTKKATSSRAKKSTKKVVELTSFETEYYDLPYGYNKTVVKVLAQTPQSLFVYWEISEDDRKKLKETYGDNFFDVTKPVLIVYNDTLHYSYEIDINDFANSWYIHINDSKCDYRVELGRKHLSISKQVSHVPYYTYITSSNEMTAPNNKILFNPNQKAIQFRNIKTGQVIEKNINEFSFITNLGIFTIQDLYKYIYPNEDFEYENFFSGNPSSGNPTSGSFSSRFK